MIKRWRGRLARCHKKQERGGKVYGSFIVGIDGVGGRKDIARLLYGI